MLIILELEKFGSKKHEADKIVVVLPTNLYLYVSRQSVEHVHFLHISRVVGEVKSQI